MAREIKDVLLISLQPASMTDATHPVTYAAVADSSGDTVHDVGDASELTAQVIVHSHPTGTSPTLDAKLQESNDKNNWTDVAGATVEQFAGAAPAQAVAKTLKVPGPAVTDAKTFARYVRIMAAIGGSDTPTYSVTYYLYKKE